MITLNAESRNMQLKPKQLRRSGSIPGVLYGKNLEESLIIQFSQKDASKFLKTNSTGSTVSLVIGSEKYPALLREVSYKPASGELEHLSFQTLLAGEIITSIAKIILLNRELVDGMIQQPQDEISYKALPKHLIDRIEIDLDGKRGGDSMRVSDLDIANDPNIEILTPLDAMVFSIVERRLQVEVPEAEEEEPVEETEE